MTSSTRRPLVVLLAGVLAVSACGGGDDTSSIGAPTEQSEPDVAPTDPDDNAEANVDEAVKIGEDAIDAALGDISEECKAVALSFGAAMSSAFGTPEQQSDVAKVFASIEGKVPDELRDDVDVFVAAVTAFYDGRDPSSITVDPMEFFAALEAPEVAAAAENIQAFMEENCAELVTP